MTDFGVGGASMEMQILLTNNKWNVVNDQHFEIHHVYQIYQLINDHVVI